MEYPMLGPTEIPSPLNKAHIQWIVKNGSTVRTGQLIARCSSSPLPDANSNGTGASDASGKVAGGADGKPKIIRARRRNLKHRARPTIPPKASVTASAGTSASVSPVPSAIALAESASSSFLGKYFDGNMAVDKDKDKPQSQPPASSTDTTSASASTAQSSADPTKKTPPPPPSKHDNTFSNDIQEIRAHCDGFLKIYVTIQCRTKGSNKDGGVQYVLGNIEPCKHNIIMENLCVDCGQFVLKNQQNRDTCRQVLEPISSIRYQMDSIQNDNDNCARENDPTRTSSQTTTSKPTPSHSTRSDISNKTDKLTLAGGVTVTISKEFAQTFSTDTSQSLRMAKKLNLVLDLDHTLLHATADRRAREWMQIHTNDHNRGNGIHNNRNHTNGNGDQEKEKGEEDDEQGTKKRACRDVYEILLPPMEGHPMAEIAPTGAGDDDPFKNTLSNGQRQFFQPHYVKLRPHLAEFMVGVMNQFEITIYTAGTRMYANKIADVIARHVADYLRLQKGVGSGGIGAGKESEMKPLQKEEPHGCLDEKELYALRDEVERMRKHVSWWKSKKTRKEYVERMNKEFQLQKEKDCNKDEEVGNAETGEIKGEVGESGSETNPDVTVPSDETTATRKEAHPSKPSDERNQKHAKTKETNGVKVIDDESKTVDASKGNKRKRVTFDLEQTNENENENKSKTTGRIPKKKQKGKDNEPLGEDPVGALEELEQRLKLAEKKEAEAQKFRKKIFGSRIISRTDVGDLGRDVKSLKRVFPCGGMMAAIVDDREDVWANAENNSTGLKGEPPDNMIYVKPYHWKAFQKFADVNNSAGEDLTKRPDAEKNNKNGNDEKSIIDESTEKQLLWTGDILSRIHSRYYDESLSEEDRNKLSVPSILKQMRKSVFYSVSRPMKFLLSGLVPLHKQNYPSDHQNSRRPHVVRYAEELSATIVSDVTNDLTHVVAARDGTDKVLRARRIPGVAIVGVSWLMECYWSCTLRDITPHILGAMPLPMQSQKRILLVGSDSSEDEDEDEDFIASFEREMAS